METPLDRIGGDRRQTRRYTVDFELDFKVLAGQEVLNTGHGRISNMSTGGILFQTDTALPVGAPVEIAIRWVPPDQNARSLILKARAQVVRSDSGGTAVEVMQYEFASEHRYLLRRSRPAHLHSLSVIRPSGAVHGSAPIILIVESQSTQLLIRSLLERKGYMVLPYSIQGAVRELSRPHLHIDLLITDTPQEFDAFPDLRLLWLLPGEGSRPDLAIRPNSLVLYKPFTYPELLRAVQTLLQPGFTQAGLN